MACLIGMYTDFAFNRTYDLLDTRWKPYIVYTVGSDVYRFGDLKRIFHSISRVTLTKYLHELERDGFIKKKEYPAPPLKTEYSLTELGLSVYPIIESLISWGEQ